MKRITLLLSCCALLLAFGASVNAQEIQQGSAGLTMGDDGEMHATVTNPSVPTTLMATTLSTIFDGGNGGDLGGAVYFDLTVGPSDITITDMETHTEETGPFSMDIYVFTGTYVGNEDDPAPWGTPAATASGTAQGLGIPSPATLDTPLTLMANTTYGVALVMDATHGHDYTNGDGSNQQFSNADITLDLGSATNVPFTGPIFNPRVWNGSITYDLGGGGPGGDTCNDAIPIACNETLTGDTGNNTDTGGQNASPDAWFTYTGAGTPQQVTASLCDGGTTYDSRLTVYDSCGGAVIVTNDDTCGLQSEVTWSSDGTSTYIIAVEGFGTSSAGPFSLAITADDNCFVDNDTCENATEIACGETIAGDTSNNTDQGGNNDSPDEWFEFTGTGDPQIITASLCDGGTTYDSRLTVFDACGGAIIATNDDSCGLQSELTFLSDGTSTYYIAVEGFATASAGPFSLAVSCTDIAANDECEDALAIECGVPVFGSTDNATLDVLADCGTSITSPGVWYVYEDTTGLVTDITVDTCGGGTDYDTKLSVFTGDCGDLVCVGGNDDDCGLQSSVSFQSDGASTYYILVHGFGGGTGNFELNMSCTPVPPPNDLIVNSIDVDEAGIPYTDPAVAMPAATLENGNPTGCNIDGANGVWYNFVAAGSGTANAQIVSPAGSSYVVFFKAPDEEATEEDLEYFFQVGNQCAPATEANITTQAGQAYYVFVVNTGGVTDIVIDGELLSTVDNVIEGFEYYPNPANETLNLSAVDNIERVAIYNLLGQEVLSREVGGTNTQLNVASLQTGAYLMKVTVNGQVGTYKVIKR